MTVTVTVTATVIVVACARSSIRGQRPAEAVRRCDEWSSSGRILPDPHPECERGRDPGPERGEETNGPVTRRRNRRARGDELPSAEFGRCRAKRRSCRNLIDHRLARCVGSLPSFSLHGFMERCVFPKLSFKMIVAAFSRILIGFQWKWLPAQCRFIRYHYGCSKSCAHVDAQGTANPILNSTRILGCAAEHSMLASPRVWRLGTPYHAYEAMMPKKPIASIHRIRHIPIHCAKQQRLLSTCQILDLQASLSNGRRDWIHSQSANV